LFTLGHAKRADGRNQTRKAKECRQAKYPGQRASATKASTGPAEAVKRLNRGHAQCFMSESVENKGNIFLCLIHYSWFILTLKISSILLNYLF
jgi:hypothetical protein